METNVKRKTFKEWQKGNSNKKIFNCTSSSLGHPNHHFDFDYGELIKLLFQITKANYPLFEM